MIAQLAFACEATEQAKSSKSAIFIFFRVSKLLYQSSSVVFYSVKLKEAADRHRLHRP